MIKSNSENNKGQLILFIGLFFDFNVLENSNVRKHCLFFEILDVPMVIDKHFHHM